MVVGISLLSLVALVIVPFMTKNSKCGHLYKYIYAFMIGMAVAALFADAILHLIPHVRSLSDCITISSYTFSTSSSLPLLSSPLFLSPLLPPSPSFRLLNCTSILSMSMPQNGHSLLG